MFDQDLLCRAALYPKFAPAGVFDEAAFLSLHKIEDGLWYAMSLASRYLLRTEEGAHGYGRRSANVANAAYRALKGHDPDPLVDKVYYLGFYDLPYWRLSTLPLECYRVEVRWLPEHGEDSHFQLELHRTNHETGKVADKRRRRDRTAALVILAMCLWGPRKYDPSLEDNYPDDLTSAILPDLPRLPEQAVGLPA